MAKILSKLANQLESIADYDVVGKVSSVRGLLLEVEGVSNFASVGSGCLIFNRNGQELRAEVIGFSGNKTLLMPFGDLIGIGIGCQVLLKNIEYAIYPDRSWLGRIVNCFGEPIDGKGPLKNGNKAYYLKATPPSASQRKRVGSKIDMGVRAINAFTSCCRGQRLGIFAGSGVGKSMLLAMFSKYSNTDIKIIGLVGERGREVQEFIEDYLGDNGLAQSIVVVATSDESALAKRQAAYLTMTLSEYFRDEKMEVLTMIDSITRFAMAQREIGLSANEPPTTKGYTPSVFSELPRLLERAGPGTKEQGNITGIFSVLVEGDDDNEPISDTVRGILDGHIVLDRAIAARGRYPSINILKSISRMMPMCNNSEENHIVDRARELIATYDDMADMIKIGAYKEGSNANVDEAIAKHPLIEQFIKQKFDELDTLEQAYSKLATAIN